MFLKPKARPAAVAAAAAGQQLRRRQQRPPGRQRMGLTSILEIKNELCWLPQ
jgi:hypothetical protein